MKNLSDKEKLVLYLTVVEEKKTEQVAEIMATTPNNVCQIKSRAVKKFLNKLSNMN
jgi:DNA-directed RNA polymerase specialized sigma subunit